MQQTNVPADDIPTRTSARTVLAMQPRSRRQQCHRQTEPHPGSGGIYPLRVHLSQPSSSNAPIRKGLTSPTAPLPQHPLSLLHPPSCMLSRSCHQSHSYDYPPPRVSYIYTPACARSVPTRDSTQESQVSVVHLADVRTLGKWRFYNAAKFGWASIRADNPIFEETERAKEPYVNCWRRHAWGFGLALHVSMVYRVGCLKLAVQCNGIVTARERFTHPHYQFNARMKYH